MKARCLVLAALVSCAMALGACHSEQKKTAASMGFVNTKCPMKGEELGEDGWDRVQSVDYKGKKYGFCCGGCAKKFNALSDADKDKKIAGAK